MRDGADCPAPSSATFNFEGCGVAIREVLYILGFGEHVGLIVLLSLGSG